MLIKSGGVAYEHCHLLCRLQVYSPSSRCPSTSRSPCFGPRTRPSTLCQRKDNNGSTVLTTKKSWQPSLKPTSYVTLRWEEQKRDGKYSFLAKTWLPLSAKEPVTYLNVICSSIHPLSIHCWVQTMQDIPCVPLVGPIYFRHWLPAITLRKRHRSVLFDVIYSKYSFMDTTTQCLETFKRLADHSFVNLGVSMSITFSFCSFCVCLCVCVGDERQSAH